MLELIINDSLDHILLVKMEICQLHDITVGVLYFFRRQHLTDSCYFQSSHLVIAVIFVSIEGTLDRILFNFQQFHVFELLVRFI